MKKKIIVTGGLGFIGCHLVEALIKKGFFVIILDNYSYSSNINNLKECKKNYKVININICDPKVFNILSKYKPIGLFNLAAETHVDRSIDNPKNFINTNFVGTYNLLECTKRFIKNKKVKFKFVHISTDEVYGDIKPNHFSKENDAFKPNSPYAASKGASNLLVRSYNKTYKFPAIITNCSNNFGPNQFPEKLIPKMIINAMNDADLPIYGNGKNYREWIYVKDHCEALIKVFNKGKLGENYNIGSGKIFSNNLIIKILLQELRKNNYGKKSKIIYVKDRPSHDKRYALNSNKIRKSLKWKPKYNFKKSISDTVKWYISNQDWIKKINKKKYKERMGLK